MKIVRKALDFHENLFKKGSKLEKFYPLHEALDTFLFTPGHIAKKAPYIRDHMDLKRLMIVVVTALFPCILMAMYNTGLQANLAIEGGLTATGGWRTELINLLGVGFNSSDILACFLHGAVYYIPVLFITFAVGGIWEVIFAVVRKHEINEGFFVTGMLLPLIVPPSIPLWQVALGISFGVVIGKEVFGGTGMNFLNPALTARCFLFFAYPQDISGNSVWVAVDSFSGATPLAAVAENGMQGLINTSWSWLDAFFGVIPGSMGETSTLCCLFGAAVLILTGVGSWYTMISIFIGTTLMAVLWNLLSGVLSSPFAELPFFWHYVVGGWAFGAVFMATDPVSSPATKKGQLIYGFLIGVLAVLIRAANPAYPEGMMLAILFMNVFAPLIDYGFIKSNIKKRAAGYGIASKTMEAGNAEK